ncbi:hypothetical protein llg_19330 [Luteolibacter sp. LG18]|nr:hypothetical protein llg_19330 [Luteolibacter sp. LG18]
MILVLVAMVTAASAMSYGLYRIARPESPAPNAVCGAIVFLGGTEPLARSSDPRARERYQRIVARSEAWWQETAARYPDLVLACREVTPERNGFLRWTEFQMKRGGRGLDLPAALSPWIAGSGKFDRFEAKRWIVDNRPLLDELKAIGELPDQSVKDIPFDRWKLDAGHFAVACAEMMMLEARTAAEDGDEAAAARCMRAVQGFANHFERIEVPDDEQWSVAACIGSRMRSRILHEIMPALSNARACHPETWDDLLQSPAAAPRDYARLLRGDWQMTLREFLLPTLGNLRDQGHASDAQALVDAYSERMRSQIALCERADGLTGLPSWNTVIVPPANLSQECRDLFRIAMDDRCSGSRGWVTRQVQGSLDAAAFDIMCGGPVPREPVSGKPFAWNETRRELALPDAPCLARVKVQPLSVPEVVLARSPFP